MTVEIEFSVPANISGLGRWQVEMAKQIETTRNFPVEDLERQLDGDQLVVSVETSLPNQAVENMVSDIEDHLPKNSTHIETREVNPEASYTA